MACFDYHRAEITVMQFTGHPLPVHQFLTVPWDFNHVPYCQPSSPTPTEYETSTVFGMACLAGLEVNIQQQFLYPILRRYTFCKVFYIKLTFYHILASWGAELIAFTICSYITFGLGSLSVTTLISSVIFFRQYLHCYPMHKRIKGCWGFVIASFK